MIIETEFGTYFELLKNHRDAFDVIKISSNVM